MIAARPDHRSADRRRSVGPACAGRRPGRRRARCRATATSAASSRTTCCRPRSAPCARRRSCPRRWPRATRGRAGRASSAAAARLPRGAVRNQPRGLLVARDRGRVRRRERRRQRARPGAELRRSRLARGVRGVAGADAAGGRARGPAGGARAARPARRVGRPAAPPRAPGLRDPDAAALGPRDAPLRTLRERAAARRRARTCSARRSSAPSARRAHRGGPRARRPPRRPLPRTLVRAGDGRLRLGRDRARLRVDARDTALGLPLRGVPGRDEARFVGEYFAEQPIARAGIAVDAAAAVTPGASENVLVAGADAAGAVPWQEESGDGIALASGYRAAQSVLESSGVEAARGIDRLLEELMRGSLDHCVKCTICETQCPVSNVTPLFPGPKYVGPQAERFRVADEPSPDASVDYCSGCGICTQVCPQGVHIAEINTQARDEAASATKGVPLRDRIIARPTWPGRAGHAGRAARELDAAQPPAADPGREDARHPPRRGDADVRRADVPGAGRASTPPPATGRKVVYFHGCGTEYYEPRRGREGRRDPRAQRLRGRRAQAGLLRAAAAVQRPLRRRPQATCCGSRATSRRTARDGRADRRQRRRAARSCSSARRARSSSLEDDPDLKLVTERTYDICEFLLELHDRGELKTDFEPVEETVAYHAPCQQQGHGIGKPALDLIALVPGLQVDRDERHAAAASPARTGSRARSTRSRWTSAPTCSGRSRAAAPDVACATARRAAGRSRRRRASRGAPGRDAAPRVRPA